MPIDLANISGSMCTAYSTLGKKVDGHLQRENSEQNKLLLLWSLHHGRAQTPMLVHENVRNFGSEYLANKLAEFDYVHIASIKTKPSDAAIVANSRDRKRLGYIYIYFCIILTCNFVFNITLFQLYTYAALSNRRKMKNICGLEFLTSNHESIKYFK